MVFSSLTFIFFFLAITFIAYFAVPGLKGKNIVLLIASLVFYSWGEPKFIILMLLTVAAAYIGGLYIDKNEGEKRKLIFVITTVLILASLFVFKYLDFSLSIFGIKGPGLALPIGISFYTFQVLSYVIDLYWEKVEVQTDPGKLLLYVAFFPQLIAGPIVRYSTVADEISTRKTSINDMAEGARRFILGLGKKAVIANGVAQIAELVYAGTESTVYGCGSYWLAAICYTLQIYYDFSGYSDMAIGLGRIFGFHFLENFDQPYLACSVTDFWRRWHISMSSWFRDYIYIPLGGNRVSRGRWVFNILVVWSLTGLWHGASWNFIFWGLYYAAFLMLEKFCIGRCLEKTKVLKHIYTMLVIIIGWVLFNLTDAQQLFSVLGKMFSFRGSALFDVVAEDASILKAIIFVPLGVLGLFAKPLIDRIEKNDLLANILSLALLLLSIVFIASTSYNPFIYFRF